MLNNEVNLKQSVKILLAEIIDYAGLFPPSQLSMAVAVQNYANYLKSAHSWMLGRFIVPVANLDKFRKEAEKYFDGGNPWRLSVIVGENALGDMEKVNNFNRKNEGKFVIETLEIKADSAEFITQINKFLPKNLLVYFEIPPTEILTEFMTALAITKTRAKIRTGGVTTDAFPSTDAIIKFMRICIAANVPFKATAGLHHPLRSMQPMTYEANAPKGIMHGFLNLFLSAAFLRQNLNNAFVHRLMNETDAKDFRFEDDKILWQDHTIDLNTIKLLRERNAVSFGSCSFSEPIEDLQNLGIF